MCNWEGGICKVDCSVAYACHCRPRFHHRAGEAVSWRPSEPRHPHRCHQPEAVHVLKPVCHAPWGPVDSGAVCPRRTPPGTGRVLLDDLLLQQLLNTSCMQGAGLCCSVPRWGLQREALYSVRGPGPGFLPAATHSRSGPPRPLPPTRVPQIPTGTVTTAPSGLQGGGGLGNHPCAQSSPSRSFYISRHRLLDNPVPSPNRALPWMFLDR